MPILSQIQPLNTLFDFLLDLRPLSLWGFFNQKLCYYTVFLQKTLLIMQNAVQDPGSPTGVCLFKSLNKSLPFVRIFNINNSGTALSPVHFFIFHLAAPLREVFRFI